MGKVKSQRAVECGEECGADGYLALEFHLNKLHGCGQVLQPLGAAFWFINVDDSIICLIRLV